jgi:hypothetical protein
MSQRSDCFLTRAGSKKLREFARQKGLGTWRTIASHLQLSIRQTQNVFSGDSSVSPDLRMKLLSTFDISEEALNELTVDSPLREAKDPVLDRTNLLLYSRAMRTADWKDVVTSQDIIERIVKGDFPPLATVVSATTSFPFLQKEDKQKTFSPFLTDNVFFQLAVTVSLRHESSNESHLVCYKRTPQTHQFSGYQGDACSFGISYLFRQYHRFPHVISPMDVWLNSVQAKDARAEGMLTEGSDAILRQLLAHKLFLQRDHSTTIQPLGIIVQPPNSRDTRRFCWYLFSLEILLNPGSKPEDEITSIPTGGDALVIDHDRSVPNIDSPLYVHPFPLYCKKLKEIEPNSEFRERNADGTSSRPGELDVLACEALKNRSIQNECGSSIYRPGFALV